MTYRNYAKMLGFCLTLLLVSFCGPDESLAQNGAAPNANALAAQTGPASTPAGPSHLAIARALIVANGMSRSFDVIIPQFMDQIAQSLTQTRPELSSDLAAVLAQLKPEFEHQVGAMVDIAAEIYTRQMSEPDLEAAVAFFESSAGKKYVETQPAFLTEAVTAMQRWQGEVSTGMMTRVREEMKKKGHEI